MSSSKPLSYRDAGVDIEAGDALVDDIKKIVRSTRRPEVLAGVGGFGALVSLPKKYKKPILVSGTDGVGTKLKLGIESGNVEGLGIDLVAMCVNDVLVSGAEPLFFLDYYATGKLDPRTAALVIRGIATGCKQAGCALVGGETAEMPGLYTAEDFDLAGFCVAVVEQSKIIDGSKIAQGDVIVALPSSGPHSNGYSLVRKILAVGGHTLDQTFNGGTLGDALLAPTQIYVKPVHKLLDAGIAIRGMAHITGGGVTGNLTRCFPKGTAAVVDTTSWKRPAIFDWLQTEGSVEADEMWRVFNCGVGFAMVIPRRQVDEALGLLRKAKLKPWVLGEVTKGSRTSVLPDARAPRPALARVVVLVSGQGRNLQALIDACGDGRIPARIVGVISNRPAAASLERARLAGLPTQLLSHQGYAHREQYDAALMAAIDALHPDIVLLAGFMRILTGDFVRHYAGRLLNIHPSLLPRHPGLHTHRRALEAGDTEHGATVHFVTEELDGGPAVIQGRVSVLPDDDADTLSERVMQQVETRIYPQALAWMARGELALRQGCVWLHDAPLPVPRQLDALDEAFR